MEMSDVSPMEIQDVDMEKPMEIWEVKNMKISELKNMKFSNLTNMDISELIKNKAQLLEGVEQIDKIIRGKWKEQMVTQSRVDAFVVETLRFCTMDIPELGEEWIASMQQPQFMGLFHMAFVTRKYNNCYYKNEIDQRNYEFQEYFGDSFLRSVMIEIITKRFPQAFNYAGKDFCSKIIIEYCKDKNLAFVARKLNFNLFIQALDQEKETEMEKILEDVVEAFIGALWMACRNNKMSYRYRFDILESFIRLIFDDLEKKIGIFYHTCSNPKNILNVTLNAKSNTLPRVKELKYTTVPIISEPKEKLTMDNFVKKPKLKEYASTMQGWVELKDKTIIHNLNLGYGTHSTKNEAESNAARAGIKNLYKLYGISQFIPSGWTEFCGVFPNWMLDL